MRARDTTAWSAKPTQTAGHAAPARHPSLQSGNFLGLPAFKVCIACALSCCPACLESAAQPEVGGVTREPCHAPDPKVCGRAHKLIHVPMGRFLGRRSVALSTVPGGAIAAAAVAAAAAAAAAMASARAHAPPPTVFTARKEPSAGDNPAPATAKAGSGYSMAAVKMEPSDLGFDHAYAGSKPPGLPPLPLPPHAPQGPASVPAAASAMMLAAPVARRRAVAVTTLPDADDTNLAASSLLVMSTSPALGGPAPLQHGQGGATGAATGAAASAGMSLGLGRYGRSTTPVLLSGPTPPPQAWTPGAPSDGGAAHSHPHAHSHGAFADNPFPRPLSAGPIGRPDSANSGTFGASMWGTHGLFGRPNSTGLPFPGFDGLLGGSRAGSAGLDGRDSRQWASGLLSPSLGASAASRPVMSLGMTFPDALRPDSLAWLTPYAQQPAPSSSSPASNGPVAPQPVSAAQTTATAAALGFLSGGYDGRPVHLKDESGAPWMMPQPTPSPQLVFAGPAGRDPHDLILAGSPPLPSNMPSGVTALSMAAGIGLRHPIPHPSHHQHGRPELPATASPSRPPPPPQPITKVEAVDADDDAAANAASAAAASARRSTFVPPPVSSFADADETDWSLFAAYYSDVNGVARAYDVWDACDSELWADTIPFDQVFLFLTEKHALETLQAQPEWWVPLTPLPMDEWLEAYDAAERPPSPAYVTLRLCRQCNMHQIQCVSQSGLSFGVC